MAGQEANFDWSIISTLLDPSSSIPGDVKLHVVDRRGQVVAVMEVHKIILALHSDHFKNTFFGSGLFFKENEDGVVVIKDTTKDMTRDMTKDTAKDTEKDIDKVKDKVHSQKIIIISQMQCKAVSDKTEAAGALLVGGFASAAAQSPHCSLVSARPLPARQLHQ